MMLVDTSAWVRHFARRDPFDLREFCPAEERVLCLPVYQEILQGIREEGAFRRIRDSLDAAVFVEEPMERSLFFEAAQLYRLTRRSGHTVRSGTDCLIAACAIRHNLPVLHHDRDFPAIAAISTLREIGAHAAVVDP
ncbi:MAG: PIN domain nuclease [Spirochaetaceae bacterium]|nr:MAG: PIN domain nuclease [Spirochaetaceae bacterium]